MEEKKVISKRKYDYFLQMEINFLYVLKKQHFSMQNDNEQHARQFNIIVNAKPKHWNDKTINYSQVVDLAFPPPHTVTEIFTVQYSRGPKGNPQGTLVDGQSVEVKSGMVFDVSRTDKS